MKIFGWFKKAKPKFVLCESDLGNWYYHIRQEGNVKALCGSKNVMISHGTMANWRHRGHLNERYCDACESAYKEELAKEKV